ncbi:MAG: hydrogenase maturation nickel metallochaperone HypA [Methanobacteriaceae archaeon]|jgi:hydrogenase nickel incorporation protein HypA/HybF|uniref:hydrogenase maturation nickel metallochaperone HypA n=1 Tax=unclassified Methanobrevibacter TaxID=2638681 RepID=UPI002A0ACE2E|nr:hydrogenase maturation nickel metallochaperone HypA [Methanobacteriaceae archaeon]MDD3408257.1 hydrogenase maturation nickel metallochaperone HypA [Methanobacteriaceae archaeon]MDD4593837.1 hydrogenase maturation nickel metallochaperone HypA [Methanobacteriaceae archaeon]
MHELSMAQGIFTTVMDTAESNDATEVTKVIIEVGRLAMINPEQISFLLDVLKENTIAEDADFVINEIPVEIECQECDYKGIVSLDGLDHYAPIIKCPKCETPRILILNGKDIIVKNIVIEKPDEDE